MKWGSEYTIGDHYKWNKAAIVQTNGSDDKNIKIRFLKKKLHIRKKCLLYLSTKEQN